MRLFEFAWVYEFDTQITDLKNLVLQEDWDYKLNPQNNNPILKNYIFHTFQKIHEENKIEESNQYCTFNTGLVTNNQEEIYGLFQLNKKPKSTQKWFFKGWRKNSDRELSIFTKLPDPANYLNNPRSLSDLKMIINL